MNNAQRPLDLEHVAKLTELLFGYEIRLLLLARDAKLKSESGEQPVEIVARFDGGVMFCGEVVPRGREKTGV